MRTEEIQRNIWIDPARCGGKPCIRGHRIWVSMILDLLAEGLTPSEIISRHYPQLTVENIHACIGYASTLSSERLVPVALEPIA
jgi:uncharacterized protein (DUF433 family)